MSKLDGKISGYLGTVCLFVGVFVFLLTLLGDSSESPLPLLSLYNNRSLWFLLAVLVFGLGCYLLKTNSETSGQGGGWRPRVSGQRFESVVVYAKEDCGLCYDVFNLLDRYEEYLPEIDVVEIDTYPALEEEFGDCVPVVEIDGKVRFRGRINESLFRRMIEGSLPSDGESDDEP